jgi:glycine hydroxymethyltransferase
MHSVLGKAIALKEARQPDFLDCQKRTVQNTRAIGEVLQSRGFRLVSGGTDNHLLLVDLTNKGLTGRDAANWLEEVGICVNKNLIPYDPLPATTTSGIRIGTPAISTRGVTPDEATEIGGWIADVLEQPSNTTLRDRIRERVRDLCRAHPIYPDYLDAQ